MKGNFLLKLKELNNKIKRFFKATISVVPNYYSDYENAYEEGYSAGYDEGHTDGWSDGKSEGKIAWRDLYDFLEKRNFIEKNEEISTFELFERLLNYERELKTSIDFWKAMSDDRNEDNV